MKELILNIELVPKTCWHSNLATQLPPEQWDILRRDVYYHNEYRCEICDGKGDKWPVECHECWEFDDSNRIQILKGFLCLCPACHEVKHYGRACATGNKERVFDHFKKINGISRGEAMRHISYAFDDWKERSAYEWGLDLTIIKNLGFDATKLILLRS